MDGIPLDLIDGGSTIAILVFLLIGFVTDRVVSGKRLREEKQEKREALEIVKGYGATLEKLLVGTETTNQLLRSLPHPTDKDGERK